MLENADFSFDAHTEWRHQDEAHNQVIMDLDFELELPDLVRTLESDQTNPEEIGEQLEKHKSEVHQEVFRVADCEMLPQIITDGFEASHATAIVPDQPFDTDANIQIKNDWHTELKNGGLGIRNQMKMVVDLESTEEVAPVQALENVRGGVASAIEGNVVLGLESAYQGKDHMNTLARWKNNQGSNGYSVQDLPLAA